MINSLVYKYYRSLNCKIQNDFLIDKLGSTNIFILQTDNSFAIYDIEKLNTLFIGPYISEMNDMYFYGDILYITSNEKLLLYKRGVLIYTLKYEEKIKYVRRLGNILFVVFLSGQMNIYDILLTYSEDMALNCHTEEIGRLEDVINIHHPMTYINKFVVEQKDQIIIYNFIKKKIVYQLKNIQPGYIKIIDTKTIDLIGVLYEDKIDIINLKQDKILYTLDISTELKNQKNFINLDFSDDKLLYVKDETLHVFDLMNKYKILSKDGVQNAKFIDNQYLLVSTGTEISICDINNSKINIIKNKILNVPEIRGLDVINNKNIVIISDNSVIRYNLYNDNDTMKIEINKHSTILDKFNDNKNSTKLEKFSVDKNNVVCYKYNTLYRVDLLNNRSETLLRHKIGNMSLYRDRVLFLTEKCNIMNINSKLIHYKLDKRYENVRYHKDYVISYTDNKVNVLNYITKKEYEIEISDIIKIDIKEEFVCIQTKSSLLFYNFDETVYFRKYSISNILDWDINNKTLCILQESKVLIYEIISNLLIDEISTKSKMKFIRFSRDNFFIVLVSEIDEILLLCTKVYQVDQYDHFEDNINLDMLNLESNPVSANWNINEIFNIKYNEFSINDLLDDIIFNLEDDYIRYNLLLNKVLKKYYKEIDKGKLREIYEKYIVISDKYTENYIRCIKY
ncbi:U3 small nucleolar RNA-associated protein 21 (UTP21) [Vairimorpha necatrix]|uniref:U3 small nucleolar RNA-associated protein 21 (UTP21) n=1 Tax=Vairimorpha necatrix TaxID=6039 RepID=A0AAX4JCC8_9MICR